MTSGHRRWLASLSVAVVAWFGLGCGVGEPGEDNAVTVRDSAGVRVVENGDAAARDTWAVHREPALDVGRAQGPAEYQLSGVTDVERTSDGRLLVANTGSASLLFYDSAGRHVRTAGGEGNGPGEFRGLGETVLSRGDTILAWDNRLDRLSVFSPDGEFVRSRTLRPPEEAPVLGFQGPSDDGGLVMTARSRSPSGGGPFRRSVGFYLYRGDRTADHLVARYPGDQGYRWNYRLQGREAFLNLPYPFGSSTASGLSGDRVCVTTGARFEVRCHGLDGEPRLIVRQEHRRREVTGDEVNRFVESVVSGIDNEAFRKRARQAYDELEEQPDRMPSVDRLIVDPAGRIWVREYAPRYEEGDRRWAVFGADGVRRAAVHLPRDFRLRGVGGDLLIGTWEGELGVEHARVYQLRMEGLRD